MPRRLFVRTGLLLLVVLFASFTTARAHQVWSESQANHQMELARSGASLAVERARAAGLLAAEISPFSGRLAQLRHVTAPSSSPLWSPSRAGWFDRQTVKYRKLASSVVRAIASISHSQKIHVLADVVALQRATSAADALQLDTRTAKAVWNRDFTRAKSCRLPGQCRAVDADIMTAKGTVDGAAKHRLAELAAIEREGAGTVLGIAGLADSTVVPLQSGVQLMSYVSQRGVTEQAELTRLVARAHSATTTQGAALAVAALRSYTSMVQHDVQRTVPTKLIVVSTEDQAATMYDGGQQVYSAPVTTGGPDLPTDHGVFHIYFKASPFEFHSPWPPGSPYYYPPTPISFWMPFDGAQGLHDASWRSNFGPGSNLSPTDLGTGNTILGTHGCVNLPYDAAQWVWDWAPIGTTVVVI